MGEVSVSGTVETRMTVPHTYLAFYLLLSPSPHACCSVFMPLPSLLLPPAYFLEISGSVSVILSSVMSSHHQWLRQALCHLHVYISNDDGGEENRRGSDDGK